MKAQGRRSCDINRREFLATVAAARAPSCSASGCREKAQRADRAPAPSGTKIPPTPEINAWIVIAPDDTVTIRIAQTELGQGVWTSNAMMVCEELQCDWSKVRSQYASANRDAREMAPAWTLNVPGNGGTDPKGGGEPGVRQSRPHGRLRHSRQPVSAHAHERRVVGQGRPLLPAARGRRGARAAAARRGRPSGSVPVAELTAKDSVITHAPSGRTTTYGKIAQLAAETPHPHPEAIAIKSPDQWTLMGTEQKNLDVPMKVTGRDRLRDRRARARHEVGGREVVPGLRRRREELRLRRVRNDARRALRRAVPDPRSEAHARARLQRRRRRDRRHLVPGEDGARRMPIEWTIPPEHAAFNTANMHAALLAALDEPGNVRVNQGDVDAAFARAARIVEATYSTPYLPRARMEPGNATVLVTDDRVDIWIGDQSPQETRFSAAQITGIPEAERLSAHVPPGRRLRPQRQRPAGRAGDHDREREPRHADPSALDARGRLHRHDVSRHGRRAPAGRARRRRLADRARSAHRHAGRTASAPTRRSTSRRATSCRTTGSRITRRISTCRSARGAASARPRTSSIARASWTSSRTPRARIRIAIGASSSRARACRSRTT